MPPRKKQSTDAVPAKAPAGRTAKKSAASPAKKSTAVTKATTARKKAAAPTPAPAAGPKPKRGNQDLVIVESPGKIASIERYLGPGFKVLASYGHIRDLPKRKKKGEIIAGVAIDDGWRATYELAQEDPKRKMRTSKKEIVDRLRREAATARNVYLATDRDREGEAIAWHIREELGLEDANTFRITFNEITKSAIQAALASPGKIDMDRVQAQEARRILDRVVGYPLSDLLGKKLVRGLSAGRVQSVAVRLVVEREREIEAFKPEEYWKLTALLAPAGTVEFAAKPFQVVLQKVKKPGDASEGDDAPPAEGTKAVKPKQPELPEGTFEAHLAEWAGKKFVEGAGATAGSEAAARAIAELLDTAAYRVQSIEQKDRNDRPLPPFTTSTLQQAASTRLRMSTKTTMNVAQKLYEGVPLGSEGQVALITYMRTDSTKISDDALKAVRGHIGTAYGSRYLPDKANFYASGKGAQEAHEAIRPTDVGMTPNRVASLGLSGEHLRLYTLIWQRFVACQMSPAVFAMTNVEILATPRTGSDTGTFRATGKILKFDGYRKVYQPGKSEDTELPPLTDQQALDKLLLTATQSATQPPPRYNEASLVKALEKEGIGRPSTYAAIIQKIQDRKYVDQRERRLYATDLGKQVTDLLVQWFPKVMELQFTGEMESELDEIEERKRQFRDVLDRFYFDQFRPALEKAEAAMPTVRGVETGEKCPLCGKPLVELLNRKRGTKFVGCSGYKKEDGGCRYIKPGEGEPERPAAIETEFKCPQCGKPMLQRTGQRGPFLGCSGYPECKTTMQLGEDGKPVVTAAPTEHKCDKCQSPMVLRTGRRGPFLACSAYPKCKNAMDCDANGNPIRPIESGVKCEKCGKPMIVKPKGRYGPYLACSGYPKCRSYAKPSAELLERLKGVLPEMPAAAPASSKKKEAAPLVESTERCPKCDGPMVVKPGNWGPFLSCKAYPACKGTRKIAAAAKPTAPAADDGDEDE